MKLYPWIILDFFFRKLFASLKSLNFCNFYPWKISKIRQIYLNYPCIFLGKVSGLPVTVSPMEHWPQNWRFCIFYLHLAQILVHFCSIQSSYNLFIPFLALFCLQNHFVSQFMEFKCSKWKIGLKIDDFICLISILALFAGFKALTTYLCLAK